MVTGKDILHKEYLDICDNIKIEGLEEYNIKQLLYNDFIFIQSINWKDTVKNLLKTVLYNSEEMLSLCVDSRDDTMILVSSKWNRKDHDGYWEKICNAFEQFTRISLVDECFSIKTWMRTFSLKSVMQNICDIKSLYINIECISNIRHRINLLIRLMQVKRVHKLLHEKDLAPRVAMCFFDSGFFENIVMQYFRKRGVITVTNQHGQPLFRSHNYDRMNQSQILNFKCDYFLAKGEFTRKQFIDAGMEGDKVLVIGSFNKDKKIARSYCLRKTFCVFLNCVALPNAREANAKMLQIAKVLSERIDYRYYVKIHPSDSIDYYSNINDERLINVVEKDKTISDIADKIDFGFFNESAIFLDMLDQKVKPYYWDSGVRFPLVEDSDSIFRNIDELEQKIVKWCNCSDNQKDKYFSDTACYYNGAGNAKENIRVFVRDLIANNGNYC